MSKKPKKTLRRKRQRKGKGKVKEQRGYHILECKLCGAYGEMPKSAIKYTCSNCVTKMMPKPVLPVRNRGIKAEIKKIKIERSRKLADAAIKGKKKPKLPPIPNLPRGWHRRKLFEITVLDKTRYYSEGKEITKKEYETIRKSPGRPGDKNNHQGFGRGWHLKKSFVAPNGDKYSYGKKVK